MNVSLVLVTDDGKQMDVALRKPGAVIGRATDVAIRIPSASVSRHHCEIAVAEDRVTIKDLGSSNGTYVNRKKITQLELSAGDKVSVGDKVFVFRANGRPETIDAEQAFEDGYVEPSNKSGGGASGGSGVGSGVGVASGGAGGKVASPKGPVGKPMVDPDDSSVADFDFLDEDDDIKKQPKL